MNSKSKKKPALGKGLSALLQSDDTDITNKSDISALVGSISTIPSKLIDTNPFNPRVYFEKNALIELSQSIATHGIIQPLTLRKMGNGRYQLISGERRFRASQLIGLENLPAYIRVANDQSMLEMALVENIQRENLNPIEIAQSYERLMQECDQTQEQLSKKISRSRSSISNFLRLLKLPADIQTALRDNKISMGHARALLSFETEAEQLDKLKQILENSLNVREVESMNKTVKTKTKKQTSNLLLSNDQSTFQDFLGDKLSSKVHIKKSKTGNGKLLIHFNSDVDLNRIIAILKR
ncbi:MAG: chromosome partitioning protein ParB [Crocinitomicaceae bacterium]|nr:chromosome partitioning protein ParB [Crocinitomicaceae bacterium]|tara:strand:+ start:53 stop:940 length:888 start_codon:yes stop_codon:yes gene_type:complete